MRIFIVAWSLDGELTGVNAFTDVVKAEKFRENIEEEQKEQIKADFVTTTVDL